MQCCSSTVNVKYGKTEQGKLAESTTIVWR